MAWPRGRAAFERLRAGALGGRRVHRVVLTHHHPDHVGLAGDLAREGARVLATRLGWTAARMLTLDVQERPGPEQVAFRRRAGVTGAALAAYAAERPFNFADVVAPIPPGFEAIGEGDRLDAGGRRWRVRLGEGHAPEQVTLWAEDEALVLAADQILPGISPNIGVHPTEPFADPLAGWLESCARLRAAMGEADPLVLPGHRTPFTGAAHRLGQLIENHIHALERIEAALAERPRTAVGLFGAIFRREIGSAEQGLALAEAVAHVNHLARRGAIRAEEDAEGALVWRLA
jgi:glyoxylase-like metal-dependent hydrolase (beta-lactamase superfamily II)